MSEPGTSTSHQPYDASYYESHLGGVSYDDEEHWLRFFGGVADVIVRDIRPQTVLDVGCATGYLVEALRERAVEAWGIDISAYAIEHVRSAVGGYCRLASILEPFPQRYDLVTCVEVVEHLSPQDGPAAVANLCASTEDVLFTSTPGDYGEETHVNVRQPEYWTELFARSGFYRDVDFEIPELAVWAGRYRKGNDPVSRVVAAYERVLWHHRNASAGRNKLVMDQLAQIDKLDTENRRLAVEREQTEAALRQANEQLAASRADFTAFMESASGRIAIGLQAAGQRVTGSGTRRRRVVHAVAERFAGVLGSSRKRGRTTRT